MYHVKVCPALERHSKMRHDLPLSMIWNIHKEFIGKPVMMSVGNWEPVQIGEIVHVWLNEKDDVCLLLRIAERYVPKAKETVGFALAWTALINSNNEMCERVENLRSLMVLREVLIADDQKVTWTFVSSLQLLNLL